MTKVRTFAASVWLQADTQSDMEVKTYSYCCSATRSSSATASAASMAWRALTLAFSATCCITPFLARAQSSLQMHSQCGSPWPVLVHTACLPSPAVLVIIAGHFKFHSRCLYLTMGRCPIIQEQRLYACCLQESMLRCCCRCQRRGCGTTLMQDWICLYCHLSVHTSKHAAHRHSCSGASASQLLSHLLTQLTASHGFAKVSTAA